MTGGEFREGIQAIVAELREMRATLERVFAPVEEPAPDDEICMHPDDQRVNFGITNGQPDFLCRVCKYRASEAGL